MFSLLKTDPGSKARLGRLTTTRGTIDTPVFMPVGTQGSVKALDPRELSEMGTQIILGNTYHLNIRPGLEIILGRAACTNSSTGKYPFSPTAAAFRFSVWRRSEKSNRMASSFVRTWMAPCCFSGRRKRWKSSAFSAPTSRWSSTIVLRTIATAKELQAAVERTIRWAQECREQPRADGQQVFGIVQGGNNPELREACAKALVRLDFDGYAIGGVSVGEPEPEMMQAVEMTEPFLPANKARYAMGLGTPAQMVELVARGVDMFDCVLPTRVARNGTAFTEKGRLQHQRRRLKADFRPIEEGCDLLCLQAFYPRLSSASAERERNPRPAHGQRSQLAHVHESYGGYSRAHRSRHLCWFPQRLHRELCPQPKSSCGPRPNKSSRCRRVRVEVQAAD